MKKPRLLLTAAVPVGPDNVRGGYDVPAVARSVSGICASCGTVGCTCKHKVRPYYSPCDLRVRCTHQTLATMFLATRHLTNLSPCDHDKFSYRIKRCIHPDDETV